jgi:aspartyl-tRNA(Asn)/glutamyl-tRNA(Gln) amidotransferase subunit B
VIGLEVHVELATATKLFCGCRNEFGAPPNTHTCPVCLGLPGSLPVLNEKAVELALRLGEALRFTMPTQSIFHRKNYFYPDMPKNFQTTQYDEPICLAGEIDVDGVNVRITRAHLEEDTGKSLHVGGGGRIHDADHSLVDYNRAGVPLLEIVSEPDIFSAEQARAYVAELRATLLALGVSDVKMEEGSMRVDANVSVRRVGTTELGTRTEIKNMNSIRSVQRAIEYEIDRQVERLDAGERIVQETRHWNEADGRTHSMRSKEEANDYRYFPEPDLVALVPTDELRARVRSTLPELPGAMRARLVADWEISEHDARVVLDVPGLSAYVQAAVDALGSGTPRDVVNWATGEVLGFVNESGVAIGALALTPDALAELVGLVAGGTINRNQAKEVLSEALRAGERPKAIVAARGLAQESDTDALGASVDAVLAANPDVVAEYRAGDDGVKKKKRGFLMGEASKALKGRANGRVLAELLDERLGS